MRIFSFIQLVLIAAATVLEYLSDKKMGVMRYLAYKKYAIENSPALLSMVYAAKALLVVGVIISLLVLIYVVQKNYHIKAIRTSLVSVLFNIAGSLFAYYTDSVRFKAYYFFLMAILLSMLMQYLKLLYKIIYDRHTSLST